MDKLLLITFTIIMTACSSIFSPWILPRIALGGVSIALLDLVYILLISLIILAILSPQHQKPAVRTHVPILMAVFICTGFIGLFTGIFSSEVGINLAVREGRDFFLYCLYFICLGLSFKIKNVKYVVNIILVIACFTAVISLLQAVGLGRLGFIGGRVSMLITGETNFQGITRVALPGLSTINFAFIILFFQLMQKISPLRLIFMVIICVGFFLSFNRGTWLATTLAIPIVFFYVPKYLKRKILVKGTIMLLFGTIIIATSLAGFFGKSMDTYLEAGAVRASTLTLTGVQKDGSFMGRFKESAILLEKLKDQPLLGFGLGAITQRVTWGIDDKESTRIYATNYSHSGYVNLLYKLGLLGLAVFLLLIFYFVMHTLRQINQIQNPDLRNIHMSAICFVISIVPHSLVNPRIMEGSWILVIVTAMALAYLCVNTDTVLRRDNAVQI